MACLLVTAVAVRWCAGHYGGAHERLCALLPRRAKACFPIVYTYFPKEQDNSLQIPQSRITWVRRLWEKAAPARSAIGKMWGFVPFTGAGVAVLLTCLAGFWYVGVVRRDLVILPAALALGVASLVMILAVAVGAFVVARRWREVASSHQPVINLETNYRRETGVVLRVPLFPFIEVSWQWLEPIGIETNTAYQFTAVKETVLAKHRCLATSISRKFSVADVLGLARISWTTVSRAKVQVLPDRGVLEQTNIMQSLSGGEDLSDPYGDPHGDRIEMRQYVPGDSSRDIIWKVFARNRRLVVRMPERALTARPRTCAYLVAGEYDDASAGVARVVLERKMLGENWCFGADGNAGHVDNVSQALEYIAKSGNRQIGGQGTGLGSFLRDAEALGYQSCLVFVPAQAGEWLAKVRTECSHTRLGITFMLGIDGLPAPRSVVTAWSHLLFISPKIEDCDPRKVVETLHTASTPMVMCDRRNGKVVRDPLAYLKSAPVGHAVSTGGPSGHAAGPFSAAVAGSSASGSGSSSAAVSAHKLGNTEEKHPFREKVS